MIRGPMIRTGAGTTGLICAAVLGLASSSGCVIGPTPDDSTTDDPAAEAAQACDDMADAVASAAARCGQDYQTNYDAFVQAAGADACSDFTSVRDIAALNGECIPFLRALSCAQVNNPGLQLPASCKAQLLK